VVVLVVGDDVMPTLLDDVIGPPEDDVKLALLVVVFGVVVFGVSVFGVVVVTAVVLPSEQSPSTQVMKPLVHCEHDVPF